MDLPGNIGYDATLFRPYTSEREVFGNLHEGNFRPHFPPEPYPGDYEGTDDGTANVVEHGFEQ